MNFRRKKRDRFDISVIPMIDVFMVLLIFFMITTTFNRESGLDINLPEADTDSSEQKVKAINLTIDAEGTYFLTDDSGVSQALTDQSKAGLKQELSKLAGSLRTLPFIISADAKTYHQFVVTALDIAGQVGFKHISIATLNNGTEK